MHEGAGRQAYQMQLDALKIESQHTTGALSAIYDGYQMQLDALKIERINASSTSIAWSGVSDATRRIEDREREARPVSSSTTKETVSDATRRIEDREENRRAGLSGSAVTYQMQLDALKIERRRQPRHGSGEYQMQLDALKIESRIARVGMRVRCTYQMQLDALKIESGFMTRPRGHLYQMQLDALKIERVSICVQARARRSGIRCNSTH